MSRAIAEAMRRRRREPEIEPEEPPVERFPFPVGEAGGQVARGFGEAVAEPVQNISEWRRRMGLPFAERMPLAEVTTRPKAPRLTLEQASALARQERANLLPMESRLPPPKTAAQRVGRFLGGMIVPPDPYEALANAGLMLTPGGRAGGQLVKRVAPELKATTRFVAEEARLRPEAGFARMPGKKLPPFRKTVVEAENQAEAIIRKTLTKAGEEGTYIPPQLSITVEGREHLINVADTARRIGAEEAPRGLNYWRLPKPVVPPAAKQPWEISKNDFITKQLRIAQEEEKGLSQGKLDLPYVRQQSENTHRQLVKDALSEGKLDPNSALGKKVLADYPDLVAKARPLAPVEAAPGIPARPAAALPSEAVAPRAKPFRTTQAEDIRFTYNIMKSKLTRAGFDEPLADDVLRKVYRIAPDLDPVGGVNTYERLREMLRFDSDVIQERRIEDIARRLTAKELGVDLIDLDMAIEIGPRAGLSAKDVVRANIVKAKQFDDFVKKNIPTKKEIKATLLTEGPRPVAPAPAAPPAEAVAPRVAEVAPTTPGAIDYNSLAARQARAREAKLVEQANIEDFVAAKKAEALPPPRAPGEAPPPGAGGPPTGADLGRKPVWQMEEDEALLFGGRGERATPLESGIRPPQGPPPSTEPVPSAFPSGRRAGGPERMTPDKPITPLSNLEAAMTPRAKPFWQQVKDGLEKAHQAIFTPNAPLRRLPETAAGEPYSMAKVVKGSQMRADLFVHDVFEPALKPVSNDLKELAQYMVLRRGEDLLTGPKPIVRLPGGLNSMHDVLTAQKELARKIGPQRYAAIEKAANELWEANQQRIARMVEEGLWSKELAQKLGSSNRHYIPYGRDDFVLDLERRLNMPTASLSSTGLKRMSEAGSARPLKDVLADFLGQPARQEYMIARNRAAQAVVRAAQELERTSGEPMIQFTTAPRLIENINISGGVKRSLAKAETSKEWTNISWMQDGELWSANIRNPYGAIAKSLDAEVEGAFVSFLRAITRPFKASVTSYNPSFLAVNVARDATTMLFNRGIIPFGPRYWKAVREVVELSPAFREAAESGGFISGLVESMHRTEAVAQALGRRGLKGAFMVRSPQDVALIIPRLIGRTAQKIEAANIVMERAPRLRAWMESKGRGELGLYGHKGAAAMRDVTVDFAQGGTLMRNLDAVFPFANAATQGAYVTYQTIKAHPKRSAAIIAAFMFPSALARINNLRFETSEKIPDYAYQNAWVFQFGEYTNEEGERMPLYFQIPKGPIAGPATFPVEAVFNSMRRNEKRPLANLMAESAWGAGQTLSPIEPSIGALAPPVGTIAQLQTGQDVFRGAPIVPRREGNLLPEQQFGPETSRIAILVGQKSGISPRLIDFALRDYTGGAGQVVSWAADMVLGAAGYKPEAYGQALKEGKATGTTIGQTPIFGRFVKGTGSQLERRGWEDFDKTSEETNRTFSQIPLMNSLGLRLGEAGQAADLLPGAKGGSLELSPAQRAKYQQMIADAVIPGMQGVMASLDPKLAPDKQREEIQKAISKLKGEAREKFVDSLTPADFPNAKPEELEIFRVRETLRPYWELREKATAQVQARYPNLNMQAELDRYDAYKAEPNKTALNGKSFRANASILRKKAHMQEWARTLKAEQDGMREGNPEVEAALVDWYDRVPITERKKKPLVPSGWRSRWR